MTDWKDQVEDQIDQVVGNEKNVVDQIKDEIERNCFMVRALFLTMQYFLENQNKLTVSFFQKPMNISLLKY